VWENSFVVLGCFGELEVAMKGMCWNLEFFGIL
jgi:hypothetical protein